MQLLLHSLLLQFHVVAAVVAPIASVVVVVVACVVDNGNWELHLLWFAFFSSEQVFRSFRPLYFIVRLHSLSFCLPLLLLLAGHDSVGLAWLGLLPAACRLSATYAAWPRLGCHSMGAFEKCYIGLGNCGLCSHRESLALSECVWSLCQITWHFRKPH